MTESDGPGIGRSLARLSDIRRHRPKAHFTFQWHVTARCDADCGHCYMRDAPDYRRQVDGELGHRECIKVLDDMEHFSEWHDVRVRLNITGGDPLLKDGVIELIREAKERGLLVGILGNPGHLDWETAWALRDAGVFRYQLSIDGRRETHDALRGRPGHFDDTLRAIRLLREVGIPSVVMFTVSRRNAGELIDVIRLCAREGVGVFDFSRLVPIGRGEGMEMVSAIEYRDLLRAADAEYARLRARGCRTFFGRKEGLWSLVEYERSGLPAMRDDVAVMSGCSVGSRSLTILADGTVYPCRRLPIPIGKVPGECLADIFHGSPVLDGLRQVQSMERCGPCALLKVCRGCMAVAAATAASGDPKAPDPQCWAMVPREGVGGEGTSRSKAVKLDDFLFWRMKREGRTGGKGPGSKVSGCTVCDDACGACAEACAACSEVCAGCNAPEG
jgi:MoaA/NifB/PqqE/SkfB family radical SAM enzyme